MDRRGPGGPEYEFLVKLRDDPVIFARKLLSLEPYPYQEKILRDGRKRIVACMGRQTGKTETIAIKALHYAFFRPDVKVLITSPSQRQSGFMFDRISDRIAGNPLLQTATVRSTRTMIQFRWGSEVRAFPCNPNTLRGYTADLAICDEAAFMPSDVITAVILPMLTATDGTLIMLSTPWGRDHIFYRALNEERLGYSVYVVPTRISPQPHVQRFLEEMKGALSEMQFRMEFECEFLEPASCLMGQDLIRGCIDFDPEYNRAYGAFDLDARREGNFYVGMDLGKHRDPSAICVIEEEGEALRVAHVKEFPLETPYSAVLGYAKRLAEGLGVRNTCIDETGVGEYVVEEATRLGLGHVEGVKLTAERKEEILLMLVELMRDRRLIMPDDRRLRVQMNEQEYELSKHGRYLFNHPSNSHDDQLCALALSCLAARGRRGGGFSVIVRKG